MAWERYPERVVGIWEIPSAGTLSVHALSDRDKERVGLLILFAGVLGK